MDRLEFYKGWLLLTSQPWGKAYRVQDHSLPGTEPTPGEVQQEFYYQRLSYANAFVWEAICANYAQGNHWPSIEELKLTITHNSPEPKKAQLTLKSPQWNEAPEPLALVMQYAKQHAKTIKEATLAVLPGWLNEHPSHAEYADARLFLESAQGNFGVQVRKRGNVTVG